MSVWRLLERPALAPVWVAVHGALERNAEARSVHLKALSDAARGDLQGLFGWPTRPGATHRLDLRALDETLAAHDPALTARRVVEQLVGPIVDRRRRREAAREDREAMWVEARATAPARLHPWLETLAAAGLLSRAAKGSATSAASLLDQAIHCAAALPADGVHLQVLASQAAGDPHALDHGRPLAGLVLRYAREVAEWEDAPRSANARRALWAEVGVIQEGLSSHVLALGLRPLGDGLLARQLREQADVGRPRKITLDELRSEPLRFAPQAAFVAENPSVIDHAARALGAECHPIVCLEGEPTVAVWQLLRALVGSGCRLAVHCDFDPAGLRIAGRLVHRLGASPWRFGAADYRSAVARKRTLAAFEGSVGPTPWDPELAAAMRAEQVAVYEEDVFAGLVADLRR